MRPHGRVEYLWVTKGSEKKVNVSEWVLNNGERKREIGRETEMSNVKGYTVQVCYDNSGEIQYRKRADMAVTLIQHAK